MLYVAIFHLFGAFSGLFLLGAFGIAIAAYFYLLSLKIEYEYSLTNGFLDIDKISGKRKRRRAGGAPAGGRKTQLRSSKLAPQLRQLTVIFPLPRGTRRYCPQLGHLK